MKVIRARPTSWQSSIVFGASVRLLVRCCGHSNLVIFNQILPTFIYGLPPSNSGSSSNVGFFRQTITKMADKIATYQFASVRCCGHSNLVIFILISSNFHIWVASIKLWFKFEYEFCPTKDNQDGRQNARHLPVCTRGHPALVIYYPIASNFHIWITFIKL